MNSSAFLRTDRELLVVQRRHIEERIRELDARIETAMAHEEKQRLREIGRVICIQCYQIVAPDCAIPSCPSKVN